LSYYETKNAIYSYLGRPALPVTICYRKVDDRRRRNRQGKGIVEIFEYKGKVYGRIIEIFEQEKRHFKCERCEGEDKNKPILGLIIIKGLSKKGEVYEGGKITDPKNGKSYHCKITLAG